MKFKLLLVAFVTVFLTACAGTGGGLGSISKTNQLMPGMRPADVKEVLGEPSQTQFVADKWVWKYSLHQPWKGFVPYYMVFARDTQSLVAWYPDEGEYIRQQQLWLQAMPPTQKHEVDVRIKKNGF